MDTVIGLIFIDSYDEVLESMEEVRRSLLVANIDKKLNALALSLSCIIRKFDKDKFILIMTQENLETLKQNKFEILNSIREINMGNKIPTTLSIGIGINDEGQPLSSSMEFARAAIDLALGRGGDQVVIKSNDKFFYYGGKTKEVSNNTRVRTRVKAFALTELIQACANVIVMGHRNPDLDSFGASIGVKKIATSLGKHCSIVIDDDHTAITSHYEAFLSQKEYKDVFVTNASATSLVHPTTLLVVVDTHRKTHVSCPALLGLIKDVVVIDHHRKSENFIDNTVLSYHEPYASSTCELITEMFLYLSNKIHLLGIESDALLAGLTIDTKGFVFKTGARTLEAAAFLKRSGADSIKVRQLMQIDLDMYKARSKAIISAETYLDDIAISACQDDVSDSSIVAAQAADELLTIKGISTSFVLCFDFNGDVLISARSLGKMNVQMVMELLGGGGHQTIAGCRLPGETLDNAREILKSAITKYITNYQ